MSALLEVHDVTVRFGGVAALDGVDLAVREGEVTGLIGPNGAGKSTLVDVVSGFTGATTGHISFDGTDLTAVAAHDRVRSGLARTFQSLELFEDLPVRDNLAVCARAPSWRDTVTDALWPKRRTDEVVDELLDELGLAADEARLPSELPNGRRHLVALARALASRPRLLLLDEPAAGLDPAETAALADLVSGFPARGISVLLIDHDMSLIMGTCHQVHVLDFGRLIASGPPAAVRAEPAVRDAYLGAGR